jgi:hypothetical protein
LFSDCETPVELDHLIEVKLLLEVVIKDVNEFNLDIAIMDRLFEVPEDHEGKRTIEDRFMFA